MDGSDHNDHIRAATWILETATSCREYLGPSDKTTVYVGELKDMAPSLSFLRSTAPGNADQITIMVDNQAAVRVKGEPQRPSGRCDLATQYVRRKRAC